ncbi:MAG: nuclear transport factor 2 family protein [Flavobacteriaceae bacterium]
MKYILYFLTAIMLQFSIVSCGEKAEKENRKDDFEQNEEMFVSTMQKHLDAVSNRDLSILESTMSPDGKMQLILPETEIIDGVSGFMEYHKEWFKDSSWTFETKILNTNLGDDFGMAITEIIYREPERNGEPYFNRMIVSYDLEKIDGRWYIIKDHASSVEKSTDKIEN